MIESAVMTTVVYMTSGKLDLFFLVEEVSFFFCEGVDELGAVVEMVLGTL